MNPELTHAQNIDLQNFGQQQIAAAKIGDLQTLKNNYDGMDMLLRQCGLQQHPSRGFSQQALTQACQEGQTQCAAFLIEHTSIAYGEYVAVRNAVNGNHYECLQLLMENTTLPVHMYQFCLSETVTHNYHQCLKILVDHFQEGADYNTLLMTSAVRNQHECVEILYPIGDPQHALMRIESYYDEDEDVGSYLAAKLQQERLNAVVGVGSASPTFKKM